MMNHPPIPISELAEHTELLKANDNLKLSQEYEVWHILQKILFWVNKKIELAVQNGAAVSFPDKPMPTETIFFTVHMAVTHVPQGFAVARMSLFGVLGSYM